MTWMNEDLHRQPQTEFLEPGTRGRSNKGAPQFHVAGGAHFSDNKQTAIIILS